MPSAERYLVPEPTPRVIDAKSSTTLRVIHLEKPAVSPSLHRTNLSSDRAHEVKFLLREDRAQEVQQRIQSTLLPDPHVDLAAGNSYDIATLYCDTPAWDVFHRRGRYQILKFRARRYGQSAEVFLERKSRQKDRVLKRRLAIEWTDFDRLGKTCERFDENTTWYFRQLARHQFRPVCLIEYQRAAYFGDGDGMPVRLTFDRRIRGGLSSQWSFTAPAKTWPLLTNVVVCELKFRGTMPAIFKSLIHDLQLIPQGVSKYRQCIQAMEILPVERSNHA